MRERERERARNVRNFTRTSTSQLSVNIEQLYDKCRLNLIKTKNIFFAMTWGTLFYYISKLVQIFKSRQEFFYLILNQCDITIRK